MHISNSKLGFLISEFEDRRKQILEIIRQIDNNERYALVVTGIFWSWLISTKQSPNYLLTWIPTIIVGYFFIKWRLLSKSITEIAEYIKKVEEIIDLPHSLGWERRQTSIRIKFTYLYWIYWLLLLLINATLSLFIPLVGIIN